MGATVAVSLLQESSPVAIRVPWRDLDLTGRPRHIT